DDEGAFLLVSFAQEPFRRGDLIARRVRAADGAGLGGPTRLVTTTVGEPEVAFGDGHHLVVWGDPPGSPGDVHGLMLDATGAPSAIGELVIAGAPDDETQPVVCHSAGYFLVVYQRGTPGAYSLRARRIDGAGGVVDVQELDITTGPGHRWAPRCVGSGASFTVVWTEASGVYAVRVEPATGLVAHPASLITDQPRTTQVAVDRGTGELVVLWSDERNGWRTDVYAQRLTPALALLDGPPHLGGLPVSTSTTTEYPVAASAGDGTLHTFWARNAPDTELYGARLRASDGVALDPAPTRISAKENAQSAPAIASGRGYYLAAWYDRRRVGSGATAVDVVAVRVRASDGAILDAPAITVLTDVGDDRRPPAVAANDDAFLVAALRDTGVGTADLDARRVRPSDGAVLDAADLPIEPSVRIDLTTRPRVTAAATGPHFVVTWPRILPGASASHVLASRIMAASTGAFLGPATVLVDDASRTIGEHATACELQTCLTIWTAGESTTAREIFGARIHAFTGGLVDATPRTLVPRGASGELSAPAIASDGTDYLVAWEQLGGRREVRLRAVLGDGTLANLPEQVLTASGQTPALSFDGRNYLAVWSTHGSTTSAEHSLRAARVEPSTTVLDPAGLDVGSTGRSVAADARLASDELGASVVVFARYFAAPDRFAMRAVHVTVFDRPHGAPCTAGVECETGVCGSGICCDTDCLEPVDAGVPGEDGGGADDAAPTFADAATSPEDATSDASEHDAGRAPEEDAGSSDAATIFDARPLDGRDPVGPAPSDGCACSAAHERRPPAPSLALFLLLALRGTSRRRSAA
ncbi:hypothetical protein L6R52_17465, partial [Myxococcota bacterium]|nr:hypothetical protein [Myxococcota bacterium]